MVERQIAVLQDLHNVFATSYRTRAKEYEKGRPLRGNPFHKNVAPIPILSENSEQIWPYALDTIDEVIRERKSFINKVKDLVERMDMRRQIVYSQVWARGKSANDTTAYWILEVRYQSNSRGGDPSCAAAPEHSFAAKVANDYDICLHCRDHIVSSPHFLYIGMFPPIHGMSIF